MPLQNRVAPTGEIVAHPARGTLMGNRGGCIHDRHQRLGRRRWASRAWITCVLDFKDRRRPLMAPGQYTELFFLDEVTALAAGHRPCGECRRPDFVRFKEIFCRTHGLDSRSRIADVDARLHADRIDPETRRQRRFEALPMDLPDGAFLLWEGRPRLKWRGHLHAWDFDGYAGGRPLEACTAPVSILTPAGTVAVLRMGFLPTVHPHLDGSPAV